MKLSFKVPFIAYLFASSKESFKLSTSFQTKNYSVHVFLETNDPLEVSSATDDNKFFCQTTCLCFEVSCFPSIKRTIQESIDDKTKHIQLIKELLPIINKTIKYIRNFGLVAHVQEIPYIEEEVEHYVRKWDIKFSDDDIKYVDVPKEKEDLLSALAGLGAKNTTPCLNVADWPEIEEAIQDDIPPPPEQEFLINAIESIRLNNYKVALIETIICLEIVLSEYLRLFLFIKKKLSSTRINKFLNLQLTLSAKLACLLDVTLDDQDRKKINFEGITQAVNWRNDIIHKTGRLPTNLSNEIIKKTISSVLSLVFLLARQRDSIKVAPELNGIAKRMVEKHKIPNPAIYIDKRHSVNVDIHYWISDNIPDSKTIENIVKDFTDEFVARDKRFEPKKHLTARFFKFPNIFVGDWKKGIVTYLDKTEIPNI